MGINNNNLQTTYQKYINLQKQQQAQLSEQAKSIKNSQVREYLEASNKLLKQLNQLDEVVLSKTQTQKSKSLFDKIKSVLHISK